MNKDRSSMFRIVARYLLTAMATHGIIKSNDIEIFLPAIVVVGIEVWSYIDRKRKRVEVASLKTAVVETRAETEILTRTIVANDVPLPSIPTKTLTELETNNITKL